MLRKRSSATQKFNTRRIKYNQQRKSLVDEKLRGASVIKLNIILARPHGIYRPLHCFRLNK